MFELIESFLLFGMFEWFFYALNGHINCCMGGRVTQLYIAHCTHVEAKSCQLQQRSKYFYRILKMHEILEKCAERI